MSYCRFGEADAYIYESFDNNWQCCGCSLSDNWSHATREAMLAHIAEHRDAGDYIPERVDERLREEIEEQKAK
jgi:hypothetical protein